MSDQAVDTAAAPEEPTTDSPTDPRQTEWDIMVQLLELDAAGVESLKTLGIKKMSDVELFGSGATAGTTTLIEVATTEGLDLITKQNFVVVATFLLNGGQLTAESTLAEMAKFNQSKANADSSTESASAAAPVKRGRGRPRKLPVSGASAGGNNHVADDSRPTPTRASGRSRKPPPIFDNSPSGPGAAESLPPKRGPGRPRKHPLPEEEEDEEEEEEISDAIPVKRGPGRPRKNPIVESPKRGPGRPRKNPIPEATAKEVPVKRGRGRPRKNPIPEVEAVIVESTKRGPGRPRKNPPPEEEEEVSSPVPVKRGRGRPRKNPIAEQPKRGPGRPRKQPIDTSTSPGGAGSPTAKRPRGRPRKNPLPTEQEEENIDTDGGAPAGDENNIVNPPDAAVAPSAVDDENADPDNENLVSPPSAAGAPAADDEKKEVDASAPAKEVI